MSCILRIAGENFDIDAFILKSKITPYKIFYKGHPKYETKPDGKKIENNGCAIEVSTSDFIDFDQQVKDALKYLEENKEKLQVINSFPGIQFVVLDFGVKHDINRFTQTHYLPNELLKIIAKLGISVEISMYQSADE